MCQYFFVLGIKNSDALHGSIWQNTLPVFTLFMGLLSGIERLRVGQTHGLAKLAGICCTVGGAIIASMMKGGTQHAKQDNPALGNVSIRGS